MDPCEALPEELFLRILSYLDPQSLLKANLVNRTWNQLSNNDELWRDKIREIDPKISENESGWKTYYSIFRQTTNLTEKNRLIYNRNSPSLGFRILSGNSVHNNNFPAIYSYGYRENETLVVIGRGYLEEFKMSEASFAFAAYLDLLEKVGYKPQVPKMINEENKEEEKGKKN